MNRRRYEIKLNVLLDEADDIQSLLDTLAESIGWKETEFVDGEYRFLGKEENDRS